MNKYFKENNQVDEREQKVFLEIMAVTGMVAYAYGVVFLAMKLLTKKELKYAYVELGLVLVLTLTMLIGRILHKDFNIPEDIRGKKLSTASDKKSKKERIMFYIKDTAIFALMWTTFRYFWKGEDGTMFSFESIYLNYLLEGLVTFILFVVIKYFRHEASVKRYNKYLESLDQDPKDDDNNHDKIV